MHLSVYVFGLEDFESREVSEMLGSLEEVEDVTVWLSMEHIQAGVIYASADYAHYLIELAGLAIGSVLSGALKEAGKDLYIGSKNRVRQKLTNWVKSRNRESKRERIRFTLTESGEMMIARASVKTNENES